MFFIFPQIFLAKGSKTAGSQIEKIFFLFFFFDSLVLALPKTSLYGFTQIFFYRYAMFFYKLQEGFVRFVLFVGGEIISFRLCILLRMGGVGC